MEISCWMINKKNFTLGFDGHFTSTKFMWGGETGSNFKSPRENFTHIYNLYQIMVEFLSYINIYIYIYILKDALSVFISKPLQENLNGKK